MGSGLKKKMAVLFIQTVFVGHVFPITASADSGAHGPRWCTWTLALGAALVLGACDHSHHHHHDHHSPSPQPQGITSGDDIQDGAVVLGHTMLQGSPQSGFFMFQEQLDDHPWELNTSNPHDPTLEM